MNIDLTEAIGFLSISTMTRLVAGFRETLDSYGLIQKQAGILWRCHYEPQSQTRLQEAIMADKNYVRFYIDDLEAKGLVYRQKNAQNRRENIIHLTEEGKKISTETFSLMLEYQNKTLLKHISQDELDVLVATLKKLYFGMRQEADFQKARSTK
ncbi:hypothetical protein BKN38_05020 [Helicobacter sp. CLO-3]|uniref:MarR family winged helix-turn-helix transcriptional regulator n=1 Tax=unclassified Helicobacter TaxID=2593540 RepID=UPI000804FFC8|nr:MULTISPECIES: MarR family transcriptional regulator [unclassified Helicobacter]OBV29884.1 hypothetical protein BA723_03785 [Helicobacter sp. CLO-3]OHU83688.1 hypothetical protein BKN38_05020 [Helicobacter sp. CLO-3]